MKILFIYSLYNVRSIKKPLHTQEHVSFGISYISSHLKSLGHDVGLLVLNRADGPFSAAVDKAVKGHDPGLVCLSAITIEYPFIEKVAGYIKKRYSGIYVIAGGIHISLAPEESIKGPFDAICVGEGEYAAAELAECLDTGNRPSGIKNFWIKARDGSVERNPARPFVRDLDSLPFPDRQIWQEWIYEERHDAYELLAGRGCPFDCTFCCNHAMRKLAPGEYVRTRSPGNIVSELRECYRMFPSHRMAIIEVENLVLNRGWALELCSALKEFNSGLPKPMVFGTNIRVTRGADLGGLFEVMRSSGFGRIHIGVESGSERVRREIMKRDYSNEDIIRAVTSAKRNGLEVCLNNIIGTPGETNEDFRQTVALNRECQPDWTFTGLYYPYPGTDLGSKCKEEGMIKQDPAVGVERKNPVIEYPGMSGRQMERNLTWFAYDIYAGHKPKHVLLARVFRQWLWVNLNRSRLYMRLVRTRPFRWLQVLE